jgi:monofunctional biosynthetic peptidoglycan transglycosylase
MADFPSPRPGKGPLSHQPASTFVRVLRYLRAIFLAYAVVFSIAGSILAVVLGWKGWKLYDSVAGLRQRWPDKTALMRIREQQWADSGVHVETRWKPVPLSEISENLQKAVLVGEDDKFYQHHGFDMQAIENAMEEAEEKGKMKRGASTITQQLAKNLYLSPQKSISRKLKEAVYTVALEHFLGKDRILELYLNVIEWGRGVYGAEAASELYYGEHASQLSLDQAASMAAVLPKPLKVKPTGNNRYVLYRKSVILQNLRHFHGLGYDPAAEEESDEGNISVPATAAEPDQADVDTGAAAKPAQTKTAPVADTAQR